MLALVEIQIGQLIGGGTSIRVDTQGIQEIPFSVLGVLLFERADACIQVRRLRRGVQGIADRSHELLDRFVHTIAHAQECAVIIMCIRVFRIELQSTLEIGLCFAILLQ